MNTLVTTLNTYTTLHSINYINYSHAEQIALNNSKMS